MNFVVRVHHKDRYKTPPPCKFFAKKMQKKCNKTILRGYTYYIIVVRREGLCLGYRPPLGIEERHGQP